MVEYDRKDFVQDAARALIEEDLKLSRAEFEQSPTLYIPSSPDYAQAVYEGIAWGLLPEAQCSEYFAAQNTCETCSEARGVPTVLAALEYQLARSGKS